MQSKMKNAMIGAIVGDIAGSKKNRTLLIFVYVFFAIISTQNEIILKGIYQQ